MSKIVSIVLPVYNGGHRVGKAIKSVLAQTYDNFELVIVNDCSTDKTSEIVKEISEKDKRIRVINNETNQKLPRSLNIGFANSCGEYLTWTSDDNSYKPEAIEKMVSYLDNHPNIDMVYSNFNVVKLDGTYISTTRALEPNKMRFENAVGACFLYRKELAEKIGQYDPNLFLAEDYEYWIRAYLHGKLHHIDDVLYDYGWHDNSLTVTKKNQVYHKTFEAKEKHFYELLDRCNTQEEKNRFLWSMLKLLLDDDEKKRVRNKYYLLDSDFMKADKKKILYEKLEKSLIGKSIKRLL